MRCPRCPNFRQARRRPSRCFSPSKQSPRRVHVRTERTTIATSRLVVAARNQRMSIELPVDGRKWWWSWLRRCCCCYLWRRQRRRCSSSSSSSCCCCYCCCFTMMMMTTTLNQRMSIEWPVKRPRHTSNIRTMEFRGTLLISSSVLIETTFCSIA